MIEVLFYVICGWIGHWTVKAVTLGRVDWDWGKGAESIITEWIGVGVVIVVTGTITWLVQRGV